MQKMKDNCGLAAVINVDNSSKYVFDCLSLQQHRGEASSGITSVEEDKFHFRRRIGKVNKQFANYDFSNLPGKMAIGHNRYATSGNPRDVTDIQPLVVKDSRYGQFSLAHNGTLAGTEQIKKRLLKEGVTFQSSTDTEVLIKLIAKEDNSDITKAIMKATEEIRTAYSLLVQTKDKIIALRDRHGVRPLCLGKFGGGYIVVSESYVLEQFPDCEFIRDIRPGEMIIFTKGEEDFDSIQFAEPEERFCIFEGIYFSNPRSSHNGYYHEDFRKELGRRLYLDYKDSVDEADIVVPVLDSGKKAALGLADESNLPYVEAFLRIHDPPRANSRSFTSPTHEERIKTAYKKLNLREDLVKGKKVVVVDDSIVRSNTMKIINNRLKQAGAEKVINCISAPPITNTCPYGMDFQTGEELVAHENPMEEIEKLIGSDKLLYMSLDSLQDVSKKTYNCGICSGCFGGNYPGK